MKAFDPRLPFIAERARVKTGHVFHCWHAIKETGEAFDRDTFAAWAGLKRCHVDEIVKSLEAHNAMPVAKKGGRRTGGVEGDNSSRATRLQVDWKPPEEWLALCMAETYWTRAEALAEAMSMHDWALAKGEAKVDWLAAWRGWWRRSKRAHGSAPKAASADRKTVLVARIAHSRKNALYHSPAEARQLEEWIAELEAMENNVVQLRREA